MGREDGGLAPTASACHVTAFPQMSKIGGLIRFRGMNDTKAVALKYFELWTSRQLDRAYELVAEDLQLTTPMNAYASAAAVKPALAKFLEMMKSARLVDLVAEGERAMLLYECVLPFGTLRTAEHVRVVDGKIRSIELVYDATELRKLMPAGRK